ncbi:hypothetical protein [Providencia sp. PROV059]|uniref:hypothetical protein n=1 Tax=Providencia sp. PROV059 TaxID=2949787 RepID=UPI00234BBA5F|nr:hypothetical protein [Providencia sp. PROV059]
MKITETKVLSLEISELLDFDPIRVMTENYGPGRGRITVTCEGKAWTSAWYAMSDRSVEQFFCDCGNDYLITNMAGNVSREINNDNEANMRFMFSEVLRLRREGEISKDQARVCWEEIDGSDDIKSTVCGYSSVISEVPYFSTEPWYLPWPTIPNPAFIRLNSMFDIVRAALQQHLALAGQSEETVA